jgi:hypothetical protein
MVRWGVRLYTELRGCRLGPPHGPARNSLSEAPCGCVSPRSQWLTEREREIAVYIITNNLDLPNPRCRHLLDITGTLQPPHALLAAIAGSVSRSRTSFSASLIFALIRSCGNIWRAHRVWNERVSRKGA